MSAAYPFSALVGPEPGSGAAGAGDLKLALLLNAVNPAIGGVLVRGEKGTAKSTAVRGLATLLPEVDVVTGCRFSCHPDAPAPDCPDGPHDAISSGEARPVRLVELPVGASEDRVAGSLDLERALTEGRRAFEPGLLAAAHRGVLYVDEVNLLGDHLVDLLLDAAAMGTNHVEREGVSVRHPARFQLVGTMNPEEGELRPQLLDRFGLTVEVRASREPAERAQVVRRRLAYEADPEAFAAAWVEADAEVAERVIAARKLLADVELGETALRAVVAACTAFEVDGLRADIVTAKTATTIAAWDGRTSVTVDDVRTAALLALPHRRRRGPFEQPGLDTDKLDAALSDLEGDPDDDPDPRPDHDPDQPPRPEAPPDGSGATTPPPAAPPPGTTSANADLGSAQDQSRPRPSSDVGRGDAQDRDGHSEQDPTEPAPMTLPTGATFDPLLLQVPGPGAGSWGRRSPSRGDHGRHVADRTPAGRVRDLSVSATLRAAAPAQVLRGRQWPVPHDQDGAGLVLRLEDLREKVREGREGNLVLFVVDASGSMAARKRMTAVKGAILSLLLDAYQRRDRIGLITFRGDGAQVALPPTASVDLAGRLLDELPTGGRTPLALGLEKAAEVIAAERVRDPKRRPLLILVTDGRATAAGGIAGAIDAGAHIAARGVTTVVVDTEDGHIRLGLAGRLAVAMRAPWLQLEDLSALGSVVKTMRRAA